MKDGSDKKEPLGFWGWFVFLFFGLGFPIGVWWIIEDAPKKPTVKGGYEDMAE